MLAPVLGWIGTDGRTHGSCSHGCHTIGQDRGPRDIASAPGVQRCPDCASKFLPEVKSTWQAAKKEFVADAQTGAVPPSWIRAPGIFCDAHTKFMHAQPHAITHSRVQVGHGLMGQTNCQRLIKARAPDGIEDAIGLGTTELRRQKQRF